MTADPSTIPRTILPLEGRQHLLVPKGAADEARRLGATWDAALRTWSVATDAAADIPRRMLPTRDRPGAPTPYILISLVPQTSWGRNLRAVMGADSWRPFVREHVYPSTGSVCRICGGRGESWPVEADEVWRYDDSRNVQRLHAIVPLCPACHEVRSAGLAIRNGRRTAIVDHLAWVERIGAKEASRRIDDALHQWTSRSRRRWTIDLSHMSERYGIDLEHRAGDTDDVNRTLVDQARRRARG